mgnify:CR=1 FL=1
MKMKNIQNQCAAIAHELFLDSIVAVEEQNEVGEDPESTERLDRPLGGPSIELSHDTVVTEEGWNFLTPYFEKWGVITTEQAVADVFCDLLYERFPTASLLEEQGMVGVVRNADLYTKNPTIYELWDKHKNCLLSLEEAEDSYGHKNFNLSLYMGEIKEYSALEPMTVPELLSAIEEMADI